MMRILIHHVAMLNILFAILATLMTAAWPAHAEINMWEDDEGVIILDSRRAPREQEALQVSDDEIETRPLPDDVDVERYRALYNGGTSALQQLATELRENTYTQPYTSKLVLFNKFLRSRASGLTIPAKTKERIASMEGAARFARNMAEGQRDPLVADQLKAKALYCGSLASKAVWDIWIRTYQAPIDILELDESLYMSR